MQELDKKRVTPSRNRYRRVEGARLAFYGPRPDAAFWNRLLASSLPTLDESGLRWLEEPVARYLSKQGRILEAGCGVGQWVRALQMRGYNIEGIDWSNELVQAAKQRFPDLPISVGDVTCLKVPDGYYAGYISLGVMEHRQDGPEPFLREARRVLAPGGIALISVPNFHALRRLKTKLHLYPKPTGEAEFYQYAFCRGELFSLMTNGGFRVLETFGYGAVQGFVDEIPLFCRLAHPPLIGGLIYTVCERWLPIRRYFGHMLLVALRRE